MEFINSGLIIVVYLVEDMMATIFVILLLPVFYDTIILKVFKTIILKKKQIKIKYH